jgi:hypothetical protein
MGNSMNAKCDLEEKAVYYLSKCNAEKIYEILDKLNEMDNFNKKQYKDFDNISHIWIYGYFDLLINSQKIPKVFKLYLFDKIIDRYKINVNFYVINVNNRGFQYNLMNIATNNDINISLKFREKLEDLLYKKGYVKNNCIDFNKFCLDY